MTENLELLAVKNKVADLLLGNTGNIIGAGISEKDDAIVVYLRQENDKGKQHVQSLIGGNTADGYEIVYKSIGHVQALCSYTRTDYYRPVCGGTSIGHGSVTAGTAGAVVIDNQSDKRMIVTNNHVGSASSSNVYHNANIGDSIYSPGCLDSGGCTYQIGKLERFVPFDEYAWNFTDCALVSPDNDTDVSNEIVGIGAVTKHKQPAEGMYVTKSGRTTGVTNGQIIDVNGSLEIDYGGRIIKFNNCIVTNAMASGGDSGSVLCDSSDNSGVGLLFAGSDQITVHNRMSYVLSALDVRMSPTDIPSTDYVSNIPYTSVNDIIGGISTLMPVALGIAAVSVIGRSVIK